MPEDLHVFARKAGVTRLAILPFANVSSDPAQDYFGEGLAAEILISLARVPGLNLVSRSV